MPSGSPPAAYSRVTPPESRFVFSADDYISTNRHKPHHYTVCSNPACECVWIALRMLCRSRPAGSVATSHQPPAPSHLGHDRAGLRRRPVLVEASDHGPRVPHPGVTGPVYPRGKVRRGPRAVRDPLGALPRGQVARGTACVVDGLAPAPLLLGPLHLPPHSIVAPHHLAGAPAVQHLAHAKVSCTDDDAGPDNMCDNKNDDGW